MKGWSYSMGGIYQCKQNIEENIIIFRNKADFLTLDFHENQPHTLYIYSFDIIDVRTVPPDIL
jgi:hypothetical protein